MASAPATAQTEDSKSATVSGWQFYFTGYLWMPWVDATVSTPSGGNTSTYIKYTDIIKHLHGLPFMGAGEARYGRFSILGDMIYLPVAANMKTPGELFNGGSLSLNVSIATVVGFYRMIDSDGSFVDIGAGARAYGLTTKLSLHKGLADGRSATGSLANADPLVVVRTRADLGHGFGVIVYGDFGSVSAGSRRTWQLLGALDYQISSSVDLQAGYRYLKFDKYGGKETMNFGIGGPFIAATFKF